MTFFYYEINTRRFIQSTNIRALEEFSGLSYHKIWNWFNNGNSLHVDDTIICGCSDLVRGKQRIQIGTEIKEKKKIDDNTGPTEHDPAVKEVKHSHRETKQPEQRDMKGYDDFFKEVK